MWDLPRPGLEPVSPALAGRFLTTAPPGKPSTLLFSLTSHIQFVSKSGQFDFEIYAVPQNVTLFGGRVFTEVIKLKWGWLGTSLVVQWLKLRTPNAGGLGSIPGQGTRSHMPQLRVQYLKQTKQKNRPLRAVDSFTVWPGHFLFEEPLKHFWPAKRVPQSRASKWLLKANGSRWKLLKGKQHLCGYFRKIAWAAVLRADGSGGKSGNKEPTGATAAVPAQRCDFFVAATSQSLPVSPFHSLQI